ncbi:hypothetical protein RQP46_011336 [Phenoliferia psychrophenolica]
MKLPALCSDVPISFDSTNVKLSGESGDEVVVALQGATVHSYVHQGAERFFVSSKSDLNGPAAIRGGIPICWPIFGPPDKDDARFNKMKQHGFARTSKWTYVASESGDRVVKVPVAADASGLNMAMDSSGAPRFASENVVKAVFSLESTPETLAVYDYPFKLTYTVILSASDLMITLVVSALSAPLAFQALFHSYLRLPASILPPAVTAESLTGLSFVDKVQGGARGLEEREEVTVDGPKGEVDRVYFGAPDVLALNWEGGRAEVSKRNLADVVLWNPGPEKGATIGDMEEGGADRYVCLEPGQVGTLVELKAGEKWIGSVRFEFE